MKNESKPEEVVNYWKTEEERFTTKHYRLRIYSDGRIETSRADVIGEVEYPGKGKIPLDRLEDIAMRLVKGLENIEGQGIRTRGTRTSISLHYKDICKKLEYDVAPSDEIREIDDELQEIIWKASEGPAMKYGDTD